MSDILIRGISIPRNCFECPLFTNCDACEGHECGCGLLGGIGYEEDISEDRRRDDCPLHELPEHGDLIDRDALKHKFCAHCDGYEYDTGACVDGDQDCMDAKIIMTAPVIVPSNKEETE